MGPVSGGKRTADAEVTESGGAGEYLGWTAAGAGDFNLDGAPDLAIGAPLEESGGDSAGAIYLFYGLVSGAVGAGEADAVLAGAEEEIAGWALAGVGDVSGDGADDLAVGAPGADGDSTNAGAVYLLFGDGY